MTLNKCLGFLLSFYILFSCKPSQIAPDPLPVSTDTIPVAEQVPEDTMATESLSETNSNLTYFGSRERKFDLLHTSLDLQFDEEKQWVIGKALLTLKPYFFDQEVLELDAKDFEIHEVWLVEGKDKRPLALRYDQSVATIYLPHRYTSEDTLKIGMRYIARPNVNSGMGSEAITDNKGLYFINPEKKEGKPFQIWTQGETEHNSKWFPTIDSPNERATQDIKLTVQEQYTTISNGVLASSKSNGDGTRTDHWKMDLPHAPYLAAIVVGDFVQVTDSLGQLPLRYYVEKEYREGAKKVFQNTPEIISFFSELLGVAFPWTKYDQIVVRDFVSGAMENTTASIFMEELNLDEREAIDSDWDYIIAHELFHQWFGNYVTLESWSNLPLNESFADYSEYLWLEHKEGKDIADMHHIVALEAYFSEAEKKQVDLIRYSYADQEDMFDSHSYAKGGRVLHMLRRYLGDEAFFASLNYYLEQHAFSSVEIHDLRQAFEKITGRDLNWFFNQWFLASGHPLLDIRFDYSQPENILLTVEQKQDLSTTPLYKLPFTVAWYRKGQRMEARFILDQAAQQFALENGENTDLVLFDESLEVLAQKQTYRGKDHLKKQAVMADAGIARYEAIDSLTNNYPFEPGVGEILLRGLNDEFPSVRELVLAKLSVKLDSFPISEAAEEKILAIAEQDSSNTVRAGAIELLNKIGKDKYAPLFIRLVNDSSYYVAGAALAAYLENENNPDREGMVNRFLDNENIRIVIPLADYMTGNADSLQGDWFHSKINALQGESLYYFIGYYGDYFARLKHQDHEKPIRHLYEIAEKNSLSFIRLAAFQALFGFIDEEGVLAQVKHLYEREKDPTIKEYQSFFLESYIKED